MEEIESQRICTLWEGLTLPSVVREGRGWGRGLGFFFFSQQQVDILCGTILKGQKVHMNGRVPYSYEVQIY